MLDYNDLLVSIKKAAIDAVSASKPTAVVFGKVVSSSPLAISIDQKIKLTHMNLVLSRSVTDHQVEMTIQGKRELATIHNGLRIGEKVILLQMQGGQKFVVLGRVGL